MRIIALFFIAFYSCSASAEDGLEFIEVADGIFMFEGETDEIFASEKGMVSNVTFVIGGDAVAVIDSGSSFNQGRLIYQSIRSRTSLPIKFVINTHVHIDHIFGNRAFVAEKPQFIAHAKYPAALATRGKYYQDRLQAPWYAGSEVVPATRLIRQTETIDLGDRLLLLTASGPAHTNHDLRVFDQQTATLIAGDLVFVEHCPVLDGSVTGWIRALTELEQIRFSTLIPGHGPVQHDKSALAKMKTYLEKLEGAVRTAIENQMDLELASNTLLADEAGDWALFEEFHKRNVIAAYTELEWE
ncbi:quinoprotein relay system zinc metallohydrolase 2 [Emcibacter sp.]|uniref:quinoprotein relay system zinc metallohydrolase 2 n=1 Tax=Emcibacter sp. TaxID=1979954 RepID=UPI003A8EC266